MEDILKIIVANKQKEIALLKEQVTYKDFEKSEFYTTSINSLKKSILKSNFGIIAEIKRKSPSAGMILEDLNPVEFAEKYYENGMSGISILTDGYFFGGKNQDLIEVKKNVAIPILRKEFIIDEFQIFESKAIGADAILLIAEILTAKQIREFTIVAKSLGLEVIMELHDFSEIDKIYHEIDMLGINNRNLKTQTTSVENSIKLAPYLPKEQVKISESGIKTKEEIKELSNLNFQGALIGESILKSSDVSSFLKDLNNNQYVS